MWCEYRSSRVGIVVATVIVTIISSLLSLSSVRAGLSTLAITYEKLRIIYRIFTRNRKSVAILLVIILLGSLVNASLPIQPAYANEHQESSHFNFGTIIASQSSIFVPPGSPTSTTISVPVTNTHPTLASSVNPGEGITFISLFATGTTTNINGHFTITRTDNVETIEAGATATLIYTVITSSSTGYAGGVDVRAFASGRLPPPGQGAVQIQLHTDTSSTVSNLFTVSSPPTTASVATATGTGTAFFSTSDGVFSSTPSSIDPANLPPPPVQFPHGLFAFTISLPVGVTTATVTVTFPSDIPAGSPYFKFQNGAYFQLPDALVGDNDGDNILTLTLTDGGPGDTLNPFGEPDGVIVDPGGPTIIAGGTAGGCRSFAVTNDPTLAGRCVIVDTEPPKITEALATVSDFLCIKGTDNTGIATVTVNGIEIPRWSGTSGSFCAKGIVKPGQTISISATDFAGNKAGAVVLASKEGTKTSQAFAAYVDKEYNPHVGIEGVVIENLSQEPLKQVRLMLSPDMDRGRFLLSDNTFKQIDNAEKVTVVMNTKDNRKEFQGYLIVGASNSGIPTVLPVDVKASDFHIRPALVHQKHPTMYLDTIDTEKLIPSITLNSWQKAEFDRALQAIAEGRSLTPTQHRVLQYATLPDHLKILHKSHQYEVWVNDGEQAITSLKGKITIKNTSDTPMNNVRIKVELASRILMFEERVVESIPVGDEVTVNFKSMMPENKILEHEIVGKVIIAPSNHAPVQIPIVLSSISE